MPYHIATAPDGFWVLAFWASVLIGLTARSYRRFSLLVLVLAVCQFAARYLIGRENHWEPQLMVALYGPVWGPMVDGAAVVLVEFLSMLFWGSVAWIIARWWRRGRAARATS